MPIFDKALSSGGGCIEEEIFWAYIIDPTFSNTSPWTTMANWSIDSQDFVLSVNTIMTTTYGGSGTSLWGNFQCNTNPNVQYGWLFWYGAFSNLPQPTILDPSGNVYANAWFNANLQPNQITKNYPMDYLGNIVIQINAAHKILEFADLLWFNQYLYNTTYNANCNDNYLFSIDFTANNGGVPIDCSAMGASTLINNIISPIFLNNSTVSITIAGSKIEIKISNVYSQGAGSFDTVWRQGFRSL